MVALHAAAGAQGVDTLPGAAMDSIAARLTVMRQTSVEQSSWPRVLIYRFIDASPEESTAMFADYEHQAAYIRDLVEAKIRRRLDSSRTEVFFRYSSGIRLLPTTTYTVMERLARADSNMYVVSWTLVSGSKLRNIQGSARFFGWTNPVSGRAGTLLVYEQFVVPSFMGDGLGFVRARALNGVRDAVDAIAAEVERERATDRVRLDRQRGALNAALSAQ